MNSGEALGSKTSYGPCAIYVHIPFCPSKCGYCDFNSYAMEGAIMRRTTSAIIREISESPWAGLPAKTVFLGGGTPTFLPTEYLSEILDAVLDSHPPAQDGAEITSEANPGTVDAEKFAKMREMGFNRISLGAQSFLERDLIVLGRVHNPSHISRAVQAARDAGFANVNLDLIFALPNQSVRAWADNLDRALDLNTEHLSLYGLTIEPNTPFYKRHRAGELTLPKEEAQVSMYDLALKKTAERGFQQYEISNFAKAGYECRHNLCYWKNEFYAAYGPGAVGFMPTASGSYRRYTNLKHPERYCLAVEAGATPWFEEEELSTRDLRIERIMLGLRLNEGLDPRELDLEPSAILTMTERGWIEPEAERIRLTPAGRHFCSEATLMLL